MPLSFKRADLCKPYVNPTNTYYHNVSRPSKKFYKGGL
jgi:hypothetical protein